MVMTNVCFDTSCSVAGCQTFQHDITAATFTGGSSGGGMGEGGGRGRGGRKTSTIPGKNFVASVSRQIYEDEIGGY